MVQDPETEAWRKQLDGYEIVGTADVGSEVKSVLSLEEVANLAAEGGQSAETLMNLVALIAKRFRTDVCSAYLLEPDRANLVLAQPLASAANASAACEWP